MICIGIDPGKAGAIVGDGPDGACVVRPQSYYAGKRIVPALLVASLQRVREECGGGDVVVLIERQQAFRGQGVSSTFTTGINYGMLMATVEVMGWRLLDLTPAKWRRAAGITTSGDPKAATIREVSRRMPHIDLMPGRCRTAQDGIADAAGMVLAARSVG